jgi:hypothetical protein
VNYKPMPCVARFIAEFEELTPEKRKKAIGEIAGFCVGYREGVDMTNLVPIDFIEEPEFAPAEGEPQVLSETSGETLAETMNAFNIHHGTKGKAQA